MRNIPVAVVAGLLLVVTVAPPAAAAPPEVIELPLGWQGEGITATPNGTFFAGSLATGAVWKGDLDTGDGGVLVPGNDTPGAQVSVGLKYAWQSGLLYVAGGPTGKGYVYDGDTGATVTTSQLGTPGMTFVNDVAINRDAAWFTDSQAAQLYKLPLEDGAPAGPVETLPLTGAWEQVAGFNANGIEVTPSGNRLLVMHSALAALFSVDPATGVATKVVTDAALSRGDGILLRGRTLFVVRNRENQVAVLKMSANLSRATLVNTLTDPDFEVPTTITAYGPDLYTVNAKFGETEPDLVPFEVVRVDR